MKSTCKVTIAVIFLVIASIANALQPTIVATGLASPLVMAVNGEFLYFTTTGETLYRIPKTSSNITPALLPPPIAIAVGISGGLNDIAFDAGNIFIHAGGYNNGYIVRRAKDLSGINTSLVNAGTMVGVNGSDMYFTNVNVPISKINVLETNPANSQIVSVNSYFLRQKTLDATSFYFTNLVNPTQIVRFDVGKKTETTLTSIPSEGNLFNDDANIYISPGYVGFGVLKISKQGGPLQTLVPGTNGAIGYTVGGGYVYYVENSTLWAIPAGGGAPINLASPVDVHNMVYDNGTLYWAPAVGTTIYSLSTAGMVSTPPVVSLSSSKLDFGVVQVGELKLMTITVSNIGGSQLTGTISSTSPFTVSSSPQLNVAPGGNQIIAVSFSPSVAGISVRSLTLSTNIGQILIPLQAVGAANPVNLKPPRIKTISPNPVAPGVTVKIGGNNFGGKIGSVLIGATSVTPIWNDTFLTFTAPSIGARNYIVTVTNPGGSDTTRLTVLPPVPSISDLLPKGGASGASVWIDGFNFGTEKGMVTVGGTVVDNILAWTDRRIGIQIPSIRTGQQNVVVITPAAGTTAPATFHVRNVVVFPTYTACNLPPFSFFECTPPVVLSATPSASIPGTIDIKLDNVDDRWYLVNFYPVEMVIPKNNFFQLAQISPDSFLLAPTSSRTLVGVSITSIPASIAFNVDGTTNIPTTALAVDIMFRILTGDHLPTNEAELFSVGLSHFSPLAALINKVELSIVNNDFVALLNALTDVGSLVTKDATVRQFIASTLKLTQKNLKVLDSFQKLEDAGIYFNIYSAFIESIARLSAPTSATANLVTR